MKYSNFDGVSTEANTGFNYQWSPIDSASSVKTGGSSAIEPVQPIVTSWCGAANTPSTSAKSDDEALRQAGKRR